jgi:hypothetical protein
MGIPNDILRSKLATAKADLEAAEAELEQLLGALRVEARAEKKMLDVAIERAFAKLRHAKTTLTEIELSLALGDASS